MLVVIRVASLLLYFFKQKGIEPDQIFIIELSKRSDAKDIIALLQTINYDDYSPILMPFTQTEYNNICKKKFSNDGIALFRDESLVEEKSTIASNIRLLKNSIKYHSTNENNKRQLLAIITDNQIIGSDDTSAIWLTFQDVECLTDEQDIKYIQNLSGQFDFSLIQYIIDNESKMTKKIYSLIDKYKEVTTDEYHERINTIRILETTMEFLKEYEIINSSDISAIRKWYLSDNDTISDNRDQIVNDFYDALNELIHSGKIKLANQFSEPFYDETQNMAFESNGYLNFNETVCKKMIIPQIKKTMQSTFVLKTLYEDSLMPMDPYKKRNSNFNEYTRKVTFASPTTNKQKRLYSISTKFLDLQSISMLEATKSYDFFYIAPQVPLTNFVPIINSIGDTYTSGIKIALDSDENFHTYVTGISGAGKTYFLLQQALFRAQTDDKVIIFDNGGYFMHERLEKILKDKTDEIIDKYISFHYIPTQNIPVDLFSLEGCEGKEGVLTYSQATRLFNIITAASNELGQKQTNVFTEKLKDVVNLITDETLSEVIPEHYSRKICDKIIHIITSSEMSEYKIDDRLVGIINFIKEIKMLHQTWGEFLDTKNKIVIITTGKERTTLGSNLIDIMLASLYAYKIHTESSKLSRFSVIIDEISFLNLSGSGTISSIVREGRQRKINLILASQDFMKEKLNKFIGNFSTKVFFRPTDCNLVANYIKSLEFNSNMLNKLQIGECVVEGNLYSKSQRSNKHSILSGKTANFIGSSYYSLESIEPSVDTVNEEKVTDNEKIKSTKVKELRRIKKESPVVTEKKINSQNENISQNSDVQIKKDKQSEFTESSVILKCYVLVEDTTNCDAKCEHGLSLFIECCDKKILLDAGQTELFAENAENMRIDLSKIDFAVLSHGHYDHSGGFKKFFEKNLIATVYAQNEITEKYYSKHNYIHEIGVSHDVLNCSERFTFVDKSIKIFDNIYLVSLNNPEFSHIGYKSELYRYDLSTPYYIELDDPYTPDDFRHEQSLVFDTEKGLIIFNSCSHIGAENIIREVKAFCGNKSIYAYIGGFHICYIDNNGNEECILNDEEITDICNFIKKENIVHVYTGHCTGKIGFAKLKEQLGDIVKPLTTGMVFEL